MYMVMDLLAELVLKEAIYMPQQILMAYSKKSYRLSLFTIT